MRQIAWADDNRVQMAVELSKSNGGKIPNNKGISLETAKAWEKGSDVIQEKGEEWKDNLHRKKECATMRTEIDEKTIKVLGNFWNGGDKTQIEAFDV